MADPSGWVWGALVVVAVSVVVSRWRFRTASQQVDRELAGIVDRAAVEDLRDRLVGDGVAVRARSETTMRHGPALVLEVDRLRLRVRLYGEACLAEEGLERPPRLGPRATMRLLRLDDLGSQGWLVHLEGADGRRRYHGWQIEKIELPRGMTPLAALA